MRAANKQDVDVEVDADELHRRRARRAKKLAERKADSMPVVERVAGPTHQRVVTGELVSPSPRGGIMEVLSQPFVLRLIVSRQLAQMYAASLLGLLWSYIQPAMRFAIYYVVMGYIFKLHQGFPYFAIHLFCGIVFVHFIGEAWNGGTRSIWQNKGLVQKMRMPREIFPVASIAVAAYHTMPQLLVLILCSAISGWPVTGTAVFAGLLGLAILVVFGTTLALLFSAWNVFFRDFQNIVATVMQFMHFLVPMMYPFSRVWAAHESHPILYNIYVANPIAQSVMLLQRLFWYPLVDNPEQLGQAFPPHMFERGLITLGVCVVLLFGAQRIFTRLEAKFPERL